MPSCFTSGSTDLNALAAYFWTAFLWLGLVAALLLQVCRSHTIIDITSSGETLRANHLKVLEDGLILASEAQLCRSRIAKAAPQSQPAIDALARVAAV